VAARPAGVILCGDAARLEGRPEDYADCAGCSSPSPPSRRVRRPGNHDDRDNFRRAFPHRPGRTRGERQARDRDRARGAARRRPGLLLYVNEVAGLLGRLQRRGWRRPCPRSRTGRRCVPPHTLADGDDDLLDTDRFLALVRASRQVKALFHGHAHVWAVERRDGLPIVSLPPWATASARRSRWLGGRPLSRRRGGAHPPRPGRNRKDDGRTTSLEWARPGRARNVPFARHSRIERSRRERVPRGARSEELDHESQGRAGGGAVVVDVEGRLTVEADAHPCTRRCGRTWLDSCPVVLDLGASGSSIAPESGTRAAVRPRSVKRAASSCSSTWSAARSASCRSWDCSTCSRRSTAGRSDGLVSENGFARKGHFVRNARGDGACRVSPEWRSRARVQAGGAR